MRQVFLSSLVTMMILIGFFTVASPIVGSKHTFPSSVNKTLYLDRNMPDWQVEQVIVATIEWHEASGGLVSYNVERLPHQGMDPTNGIIVLEITPDYPEIILLDNANNNSTLGYFDDSSGLSLIALVEARIDEDDFKGVMLHELGHSLGLGHNKGPDGIGTLMYPTIDIGSTRITETDIANFCKLYSCDPQKLHHQ